MSYYKIIKTLILFIWNNKKKLKEIEKEFSSH